MDDLDWPSSRAFASGHGVPRLAQKPWDRSPPLAWTLDGRAVLRRPAWGAVEVCLRMARRHVSARILFLRLRLNAGCGFHRHPSHKPGDGRGIHRHKRTLRSARRIVVCHLLLFCLLPWNRATTRVAPTCALFNGHREGDLRFVASLGGLTRTGCSPGPLVW